MRLLDQLRSFCVLILFAACLGSLYAQRPPNANPVYQQLRGLVPGGDVITVKEFTLKRDAATFVFHDGTFAFYGEVNGKVTGAVFRGDGHLHVTPPTPEERHNLSILNHTEEYDQDFDQVVLRFTDKTSDELHKAATGKGNPDSDNVKAAQSLQDFARHQLHDNLDLRLLQDVLSPAPGGYFFAAIRGKGNPHLFFEYDPQGAGDLAPEEVSLLKWNDWGGTYLLAFHRAEEYANGTPTGNERNASYSIPNEDLDTTIERNGFLTGLATVKIHADMDGVAVVPLNLYPTLRVSKVESSEGLSLDFVQEKKDDDPDFGVVLQHPLKKDETVLLKISYGGKDVVQNEGNSNYYPVARESWYPNAAQGLGNYATYHMVFHVPKGLQIIATGTMVTENNEGKLTNSEWKTDVPLPVAGFNLGDFTMKEGSVPYKTGGSLSVDAFANKNPPDMFSAIAEAVNNVPASGGSGDMPQGAIGQINTISMLPMQLSQAQTAAEIYTQYFGPLPFNHVAVTQQFACNYGQSWPMLVYLPICGFLDQTQQHVLGLHPEDMYWKMVTPHEVAHQWWGQTVGFRSYRDQWMSEGFANTSASIFLQLTRPKPNDFFDFWKEQRKLITEKNAMGFRPIDVGPVTMGFRLSTEKTGFNIYQDLVYPKGAYILHMIRMMMWTPQDGDKVFMETMHDFVSTYRLQPATTEDFKAIVEKHMTPAMDLDQNHTMNWFFDEYVYGTDLPAYHFESDVSPSGDGSKIHFKLVESGVSANFRNDVPIYMELTNGKVFRLGELRIHGDNTLEQTVQVPKLPAPIKRVLINYNYDVLCTDN
ncbi:MAG: M1 family aminopeptidase [Terracidiphilus sp.]